MLFYMHSFIDMTPTSHDFGLDGEGGGGEYPLWTIN